MNECLEEVAHEYFHAWNIVRIHPAEYGDVSYTKPTLSKGLWWSEGLTMFYADVLLRRSGITSAPRVEHLKSLISRYFFNPGNNKLSAEEVSMAAYAPPGFSGDYDGSTHLQGELIGTVLDIFIRDVTNGKKSMDDVMRKMMERFSGAKGFTSNDIEHLVEEVSGRSVHRFFEEHIRGNKAIDFNTYLQLIGLVSEVNWIDAKTEDGKNRSDLRVYAYQLPDDKRILIGIDNPSSCWGKAGLHTGDQVVSLNDSLINTTRDFYAAIRNARIGDQIRVAIKRKEEAIRVTVTMSGYRTPAVTIRQITVLSNKQKQLLKQWQEADTMHVNWSNVR
jgi:predicted metalloprotease with PDZ domain